MIISTVLYILTRLGFYSKLQVSSDNTDQDELADVKNMVLGLKGSFSNLINKINPVVEFVSLQKKPRRVE